MIKFKPGIRFKVILLICLVGLILIIAGVGLGYFRGFILLRDTIVFEHKEIAGRISATVSAIIDKEVNVAQTHAASPFWQPAVIEKNQQYAVLAKEAVQQLLLDTDKQWTRTKEDSPLIKEYLNTPLALRLKKLVEVDNDIAEIFVTDNSGGLVAASGKTSDFYQADETWWQEAFYRGGVFIGDIEFDESSKAWTISIAVPMKDAGERIIGICKAVIKLDSFFLPVARVHIGRTGHASLVDAQGRFLFHENIQPLSRRFCVEGEFRKLVKGPEQWAIKAAHAGYQGKMLTVAAPLHNPYLLKEGKEWWILVSQDVNEAFAALKVLFGQMVMLLAGLLILLGFLGYVFGGMFVRPIRQLHDAIMRVSQGDLDYKVEAGTGDELDECANAFNVMAANIKNKQEEILREKIYSDNIISNMIDTLIVVDPNGAIKTVNRATLDLLEYTEEELIGRPVGMLFAEEEEEEEEEEEVLFKGASLRKLIAEGSVRNFDMTYKTKNGEKIPVSFSGSVMYEADTSPVPRIIGVVGVARDMRRIKALMADLQGAKAAIEDYARNLEQRVEERTRDLTRSRGAALNMMEDIQESKKELEKSNVELKKAKEEIEGFSRGLEEKVKERTMELAILYEVSNAISYTLDYQQLLKLVMESLFKIVDYDICASLLFDADTATIIFKPAYPASAGFVNEVKSSLINSTAMLTGENIRGKHTSAFFIPSAPDVQPEKERVFDKLRSFFNVPFVVRGKTIGMINVSSCEENAFSENDVKLIYTIANQASTAIARLQAVITAEKSKMESMVESMAEGVIMVDERGEIVVLNPQARRMLGFEPAGEVTTTALNDKLQAAGLDKSIQDCQSEESLISKEIIIPQKEGQILRCDITPVKNADGGIIGVVTILRDITREKEIDKMKTEFISTVSHELRTPLTTMKEFALIISDEIPGKLNKEQREYLDIIRGNIDRLARLINDLLDISKIEAGRTELKKALVDAANLADGVISTLTPEAEKKHLEVKTLFSSPAINVYADQDKLIQVFTNLIGNAIKFTPEQGTITVEIKDIGKEIECVIADTGKGIAPENMDKLFTKFQQFGRVAGAGAKGTGLGLAICKELVEMQNGRIWAESKVGQGSKFIFTLPKHTAESLLKEYVNNGIKQAMKNNAKMSLIAVSLADLNKLRQQLTGAVVDSMLKDMEDVLRNSLRNIEGDTAFKDDGRIFVILADCGKENVLRVEGRMEHILEQYLTRKKLAEKVKLRFNCATYPDDARGAEGLMEKAGKA